MRIGVLIESRTDSRRLPAKCWKEVGYGLTLVQMVYQRCMKAENLSGPVIVMMPHNDYTLQNYCVRNGIEHIVGARHFYGNLMHELLDACRRIDLDAAIEVTGDCPMVHWKTVDEIAGVLRQGCEFAGVIGVSGFEVRGFQTESLQKACDAVREYQRNGTTFFYEQLLWNTHVRRMPAPEGCPKFSIDTEADLAFMRQVTKEVPWEAEIADVIACGVRIASTSSPTSDPTIVAASIPPSASSK